MSQIQRLWTSAVMWTLLVPLVVWGQGPRGTSQPLVSAQFSEKRDASGIRWYANSNTGGLTSSTSSTGYREAATLRVNGSQFSPSGRMMTADGSEYVFTGNAYKVQITRRVKFDLQNGIARLLDTFHNPGSTPVNLSLALVTGMRYPGAASITETGKPVLSAVKNSLAQRDSGFMVISSRSSTSAVLFYLVGPRAKAKPAIQNEHHSTFTFTYTVTVPPNKSVSLLQGIAQRQVTGTPSPKTVTELFKPFRSRDFVRDIPAGSRRTIVNGSPMAGGDMPGGPLLQRVMDLADRWNVERGKTDLLVLDEDTVLSGTASGSELTVATRHGSAKIPLGEISALVGGGGTGRPAQIFLRHGEILSGDVEVENFVLRAESGLEFRLDVRQLNVLFTPTDPADGKPSPEVVAFIETHLGTRLAMPAESPPVLDAATPWGSLSVPLTDVDQLYLTRDPQPIHRLVMKDRSRLHVILRGDGVALATVRFGAVKMAPTEIAGIRSVQRKPETTDEEDEEDEEFEGIVAPHFQFFGESAVAGTFDVQTIDVLTGAGVTPIETAKLRGMRRDEDEESGNAIGFQMMDGSWLTGRLLVPVLATRTPYGVLQVPVGHIVAFRKPGLDDSASEDPFADPKPSVVNPPSAPSSPPAPAGGVDPFGTPPAANPFGAPRPADPFGAPGY